MLSRSESFGLRRVYKSSPRPIYELILRDWCKEQESHFSSAPYWNQAHLWPLSSPSTQLLEWNRFGLKHTSLFQAISRKANFSMIYQIFREIQRGGESLSIGQRGLLTFLPPPPRPPPRPHQVHELSFLSGEFHSLQKLSSSQDGFQNHILNFFLDIIHWDERHLKEFDRNKSGCWEMSEELRLLSGTCPARIENLTFLV